MKSNFVEVPNDITTIPISHQIEVQRDVDRQRDVANVAAAGGSVVARSDVSPFALLHSCTHYECHRTSCISAQPSIQVIANKWLQSR